MTQGTFNQTFVAGQFYEMVEGVPKPCEVKDVVFNAVAATDNQQVIAAVTGKRILVLGGSLVPVAGAGGAVVFKSATGGTNKKAFNVPAGPGYIEFPVPPWGNFNTNTGEGVFVNNQVAVVVVVSLRYVEYQPNP